jgi:hypothetical protein
LEDLGVDETIISKPILKEQDEKMCNGFIWLSRLL